MSREDRYGLDLRRMCRDHEAEVRQAIGEGRATEDLLRRHRERLGWMQQERLMHLLVLLLTAAAELFSVDLTLLHPETNPGAAAVMLALAVLLGFYFRHYFFLENTAQHWYRLTMELEAALNENSSRP